MVKLVAADFLVEIGTEELPPKALRQLMTAFADNLAEGLTSNRLNHNGVSGYASPRRLAALVSDLAFKQEDREHSKRVRPCRSRSMTLANQRRRGLRSPKNAASISARLTAWKTRRANG